MPSPLLVPLLTPLLSAALIGAEPRWVVLDRLDGIETAVDDASAERTDAGTVRVTLRFRYLRETPKNAPLWNKGVRSTLLDQEVECAADRRAQRLRVHRVWLTDGAGAVLAEKPAGGAWIPASARGSVGAAYGGAICRRYAERR